MAMFVGTTGPIPDTTDQYNRSNTKLQAGTHDSPGEKFLLDPRIKRLFRYHFGGDGWVIIPKGRAIAPATDDGGIFKNGTMHDFDGDVYRPVLTLANGGVDVTEIGRTGEEHTRTANRAIGVSYANLYEEFVDGFNRMQPTVENEIYIELPYIPNKADAEEIEWGSFYDVNPAVGVKAGDFVMSDENGRLIKADFDSQRSILTGGGTAEDKFKAVAEISRLQEQVIGQVWAVETNLPPQGWLKWVGWTDTQMLEDHNPSGMTAADIGTEDGFPGYPYEKTYRNWDVNTNKYYPQGIPGLTNGSKIEMDFDEVIGTVQPGTGGRFDFSISRTPIVEGSVEITIDGVKITPENIHYGSGLVTFKYDNTGSAPLDVVAKYKATGQIPGVPTGWDWKGSVGAIRILLQK